MSKTTQLGGVLAKVAKENLNVFATFLVNDLNTCVEKRTFPDKMKTADLTPVFKRLTNIKPASILPISLKGYEKCLYKQIEICTL